MSEQFRKIPQKQGFPGQIKLLPFPLCHRHSRQFRCLCTEWRCVINYSFLPFSISRAPLSRSNGSSLSLNSIHWFPAHVRSFSTGCLFQNFSKEQLHLLTSIKSFGFCYYSRIKSVLTENFFPPHTAFSHYSRQIQKENREYHWWHSLSSDLSLPEQVSLSRVQADIPKSTLLYAPNFTLAKMTPVLHSCMPSPPPGQPRGTNCSNLGRPNLLSNGKKQFLYQAGSYTSLLALGKWRDLPWILLSPNHP